MIRYILAALLFAGPAFGQSVTQPQIPPITPGNIVSGGPGGVAGDSGTAISVGPVYQELTVNLQSTFFGSGAGSVYPFSNDHLGYGSIGFGAGALQSLNAYNAENTAFGIWSSQYITTGSGDTSVGMHSLGADLLSLGATVMGNDALRDAVAAAGLNQITAIGHGAMAHGGTSQPYATAIGANTLTGSSNALIIGGTPTAGDVISLAFTGNAPNGLPVTVTYTVPTSPTLSGVANGVAAAIIAQTNIWGPSYQLMSTNGSSAIPLPDGTYVVSLEFPGTASTGWNVSIAPSVSGAATETVTATGGSTGPYNLAVGGAAMNGPGMSSAAAYNTVVGIQAAQYATTANSNVGVGYQALQDVTTSQQNTAIGTNAMAGTTTGNSNTCVGFHACQSTLKTGGDNIVISSGGTGYDVLTSSTNHEINIGGMLFYNKTSVAAPAVTGGTSPTIDAHANNRSGTVTVGSGTVTSATITFAGSGYSTWSHCRVTSQSALASFAYSYTKTAITVTASSLTGAVIDYDCDGY